MEAFAHVSTVWHEMTIDKPKLVFAVIKMDGESQLATTLEIETCPTLVYLPEQHPLSNVYSPNLFKILVLIRRTI